MSHRTIAHAHVHVRSAQCKYSEMSGEPGRDAQEVVSVPHCASGCSSGKDDLLTAKPSVFNLHSAATESLPDTRRYTHTDAHSGRETLEMTSPWELEEVDGSNLLP